MDAWRCRCKLVGCYGIFRNPNFPERSLPECSCKIVRGKPRKRGHYSTTRLGNKAAEALFSLQDNKEPWKTSSHLIVSWAKEGAAGVPCQLSRWCSCRGCYEGLESLGEWFCGMEGSLLRDWSVTVQARERCRVTLGSSYTEELLGESREGYSASLREPPLPVLAPLCTRPSLLYDRVQKSAPCLFKSQPGSVVPNVEISLAK